MCLILFFSFFPSCRIPVIPVRMTFCLQVPLSISSPHVAFTPPFRPPVPLASVHLRQMGAGWCLLTSVSTARQESRRCNFFFVSPHFIVHFHSLLLLRISSDGRGLMFSDRRLNQQKKKIFYHVCKSRFHAPFLLSLVRFVRWTRVNIFWPMSQTLDKPYHQNSLICSRFFFFFFCKFILCSGTHLIAKEACILTG